jgi:hypothetical protein
MKVRALVLLLLPVFAAAQGNHPWQNKHKQQPSGTGDSSVYFVTYFSNANTPGLPDSTLRLINDGETNGNLWAAYYVLDDSQEFTECCACQITADGLNSESVNNNLVSNPLTGRFLTRGVIKVISSSTSDPTATNPTAGLHGWATHVQASSDVSETLLASSNLASSEQTLLQTLCYYTGILGSGQGICNCTPEDHDF